MYCAHIYAQFFLKFCTPAFFCHSGRWPSATFFLISLLVWLCVLVGCIFCHIAFSCNFGEWPSATFLFNETACIHALYTHIYICIYTYPFCVQGYGNMHFCVELLRIIFSSLAFYVLLFNYLFIYVFSFCVVFLDVDGHDNLHFCVEW